MLARSLVKGTPPRSLPILIKLPAGGKSVTTSFKTNERSAWSASGPRIELSGEVALAYFSTASLLLSDATADMAEVDILRIKRVNTD